MSKSIEGLLLIIKEDAPACWEGYKELAIHDSADAVSELIKLTDSKDWTHKRAAISALGNHKNGLLAENLLIGELEGKNVHLVKAAINALAGLESKKAHGKIKNLVNVGDISIKVEAIRALGKIWDDSDFNFLLDLYKSCGNVSIKKEIGFVISCKTNKDNWVFLFNLFKNDETPRHRLWALQALRDYGDYNALSAKDFLHDKDGHIRAVAKKYLSRS